MTNRTKVLRFERDAEFHFDKFQRTAEQGKYLEALVALRACIEKEPENPEYQISLAELYTEMGDYEESNFLLFELMRAGEDFEGDCVFGLGCNFWGMQDFDKARECFERYLYQYPDGEYDYEASDMLQMLSEEQTETALGTVRAPQEIYRLAEQGKRALDQGNYHEAVRLLEQVSNNYPDMVFAHNNLALAYYCLERYDKAIEVAQRVLTRQPRNAHALCNLALFHHARGDASAAREYCEKVRGLEPENYEESVKILLTFLEVEDYEDAYTAGKELLRDNPYDVRVLFLCGATAANLGKLGEAIRCFMDIIRIEPDNTIALYYKNYVQSRRDAGAANAPMSYLYQVPFEELRARLTYLNACARKGPQELAVLWQTNENFSRTLLWGLTLTDLSIKRALTEMLADFGDVRAKRVLKRFLLTRDQPDELKNDVFLMLKRLDVPQPYIAYIGGKIAEVRVGTLSKNDHVLGRSHQAVIERVMSVPLVVEHRALLTASIELLGKYIDAQPRPPVMRSTNAWAAALIYLAMMMQRMDLPTSLETLCAELGVKRASALRCIHLILKSVPLEKATYGN